MKEIDPSGIAANILTSTAVVNDNVEQSAKDRRSIGIDKASDKDNIIEGNDKQTLIDDVKSNLDKLNDFIPVTSTNLSFEFDEKGDPPFIRVIDRDNEEVIREIPSEEFREVAKALDEFADKLTNKGFIFDKTV
jgi:flagellar protein FlaG